MASFSGLRPAERLTASPMVLRLARVTVLSISCTSNLLGHPAPPPTPLFPILRRRAGGRVRPPTLPTVRRFWFRRLAPVLDGRLSPRAPATTAPRSAAPGRPAPRGPRVRGTIRNRQSRHRGRRWTL